MFSVLPSDLKSNLLIFLKYSGCWGQDGFLCYQQENSDDFHQRRKNKYTVNCLCNTKRKVLSLGHLDTDWNLTCCHWELLSLILNHRIIRNIKEMDQCICSGCNMFLYVEQWTDNEHQSCLDWSSCTVKQGLSLRWPSTWQPLDVQTSLPLPPWLPGRCIRLEKDGTAGSHWQGKTHSGPIGGGDWCTSQWGESWHSF